MQDEWRDTSWDAIVIGAGQAGLAAGYHLKRRGARFLILEVEDRLGHTWRTRRDSLTLFTPARYDSLPGLGFPAPGAAFPTKNEMADYLERYARHFELPVRLGTAVVRLIRNAEGFEVLTNRGVCRAANVVLATGPMRAPRVPDFAIDIDPRIKQFHSSEYRNPRQIPAGDVLVVGSATSGIEIALELASTHRVSVSGRAPMRIPGPVLRLPFYWSLIKNLLTILTPMGRAMKRAVHGRGAPLIRVSASDLDERGIERLPRLKGTEGDYLLLEDNRVVRPKTVIWATGFRNDFSWVDFPVADASGTPWETRGVSTVCDGLYFVGMPFQFGLVSSLVGGVGRDAAFVARHLLSRKRTG